MYTTMISQTHELLYSASMGEVARVEQLLNIGMALNAASPGGFTALHAACMTGQEAVLEPLLQHHQHQQRQQHQGSSSASLEPHLPRCVAAAASMGHAGIIRFIVSVFELKQVNLQPWRPLHAATEAGHGSVVQLLLQQCGVAVDQASGGTTALHLAALKAHLQVGQQLLQAGAVIDAKTGPLSLTALSVASLNGHTRVVQELLQAGADVHARTDDGAAPLRLAALNGHADVVQLLLQAGADVDAKSSSS
jgi:ankyrin repeat protein